MAKRESSIAFYAGKDNPITDLKEIIPKLQNVSSESRYIEWKYGGLFDSSVTVRTKYRVVKAIISFANANGGFVIFGIHSTGKWEGLADEEITSFDAAKVTELVNGVVFPEIPIINCGVFTVHNINKKFIIIHIPPRKFKPHVTTKQIVEQKQKVHL